MNTAATKNSSAKATHTRTASVIEADIFGLYVRLADRLRTAYEAREALLSLDAKGDRDTSDPASVALYEGAIKEADDAIGSCDSLFGVLVDSLRASSWETDICTARDLATEAQLNRGMLRHTHKLLTMARATELRGLIFRPAV